MKFLGSPRLELAIPSELNNCVPELYSMKQKYHNVLQFSYSYCYLLLQYVLLAFLGVELLGNTNLKHAYLQAYARVIQVWDSWDRAPVAEIVHSHLQILGGSSSG